MPDGSAINYNSNISYLQVNNVVTWTTRGAFCPEAAAEPP
jgi:hypothetical protein